MKQVTKYIFYEGGGGGGGGGWHIGFEGNSVKRKETRV